MVAGGPKINKHSQLTSPTYIYSSHYIPQSRQVRNNYSESGQHNWFFHTFMKVREMPKLKILQSGTHKAWYGIPISLPYGIIMQEHQDTTHYGTHNFSAKEVNFPHRAIDSGSGGSCSRFTTNYHFQPPKPVTLPSRGNTTGRQAHKVDIRFHLETCSSPRRAVRSHYLVCSKNSLLIVGIGPILNKEHKLIFDLIALIVRASIVRYQDCTINYIYNRKEK